MAFPKTTLLYSATTIQNAKKEGFNTAQRVGKMFVDIINAVDESLSEENALTEQQREALNIIKDIADKAQQDATRALKEAEKLTGIYEEGKGLSSNDYTDAEKELVNMVSVMPKILPLEVVLEADDGVDYGGIIAIQGPEGECEFAGSAEESGFRKEDYLMRVYLPGGGVRDVPNRANLYLCDGVLYRVDGESGRLVKFVDESGLRAESVITDPEHRFVSDELIARWNNGAGDGGSDEDSSVGLRVLPFDAVVRSADESSYGVAMVDDGTSEQWFVGDASVYGLTLEDYNLYVSHVRKEVARTDCLFLCLSDADGYSLWVKHSYGCRLKKIGSSEGGLEYETLSEAEAKEIVKRTFAGTLSGLPLLSDAEAKEIVINAFQK